MSTKNLAKLFLMLALPSLGSARSMDTRELVVAIATSAGHAEICGFSSVTAENAFENIVVPLKCDLVDGKLSREQVDDLISAAAVAKWKSSEITTRPPDDVCEAMEYMLKRFSTVRGC